MGDMWLDDALQYDSCKNEKQSEQTFSSLQKEVELTNEAADLHLVQKSCCQEKTRWLVIIYLHIREMLEYGTL